MATLSKRKRRNELSPMEKRLITPWSNNLMRPWGRRLFPSNFEELRNLTRFDNFFEDDFFENDSLMPAMNVKEHDKDFEIELAAPGFDKKDFELTIEDDVLHVCGEKEDNATQEKEDYSRKEFSYKSFKRSMVLPTNVDLEQDVKASYKNGILKVKLLKNPDTKAQEPPKKVIEVN